MGVESPHDISPATVVVTPFYSSTMVMTVIASEIKQFLHFLNVMSLQHTVSLFTLSPHHISLLIYSLLYIRYNSLHVLVEQDSSQYCFLFSILI